MASILYLNPDSLHNFMLMLRLDIFEVTVIQGPIYKQNECYPTCIPIAWRMSYLLPTFFTQVLGTDLGQCTTESKLLTCCLSLVFRWHAQLMTFQNLLEEWQLYPHRDTMPWYSALLISDFGDTERTNHNSTSHGQFVAFCSELVLVYRNRRNEGYLLWTMTSTRPS